MKHIVYIDKVPANCHAASVLLREVYTSMERRAYHNARLSFLFAKLKRNNQLVCYYCHRGNLKIGKSDRKDKVTIDHVLPTSLGGDAYSHDNFVVSCETCNRRKSNSTLSEFLNSKYLKNKIKNKV